MTLSATDLLNAARAAAPPPPLRSYETLRFADTDLNGHITHPTVAALFQNGRAHLLAHPAGSLSPPGTRWVTRKLTIDYLGEIFWPGNVEIHTQIANLGRSSVRIAQVLLQHEQTMAAAQTVMVLVDIVARRSVTIPEPIRLALNGMFMGNTATPFPEG